MPRWLRLLLLVGLLIALACTACIGFAAFTLWGGKGEPASLAVATRVTRKFVSNIHEGKVDSAYSMLSERFVPRPTIQQFEDLIRKDESIFAAYETLDVCDWGLFWQNGLVIDEQILLHYERTAILVRVSLHKDSDAVWRIQGFYFDAAADTAPFGLCK